MLRLKRIISLTLMLIIVLTFSGCSMIDDMLGEEDESWITSITVDKRLGYFRRNPIEVNIDPNFETYDITMVEDMMEGIDYINSLNAGIKLVGYVREHKFMLDNNINVILDLEHERTYPREKNFLGIVTKPAKNGVAEMGELDVVTDEEWTFNEHENIDTYRKEIFLRTPPRKMWLRPGHKDSLSTKTLFLHELLHNLGFGHVDDENSIMYPYSSTNWWIFESKGIKYDALMNADDIRRLKQRFPNGDPVETVLHEKRDND